MKSGVCFILFTLFAFLNTIKAQDIADNRIPDNELLSEFVVEEEAPLPPQTIFKIPLV